MIMYINIWKLLTLLNLCFEDEFDYVYALISDKLYFDISNLYYHMHYLVQAKDALMDPNTKLVGDQGELLTNPRQYRRLVGKLN